MQNKKNKEKLFFVGFTIFFVMFLSLTGCPSGSPTETPQPPKTITWDLEQIGGEDGSFDSAAIKIMFSAEVTNLSDAEVEISGAAEKSDAAFSVSGNEWTIPVTVNGAGTASVAIARRNVETGPKGVIVYSGTESVPITWTASANGSAGSATTNAITIIFSEDVPALAADDITITGSGVIKGNVNGSGRIWNLSIIVSSEGRINLEVDKAGVEAFAQKVNVFFKPSALAPAQPVIGKMEDGLHFTADVNLSSQAAIDAVVIFDDAGPNKTRVVDESKVRANISLKWTGAGATSYNIYYAEENFRPAAPQITGITGQSAFINNLKTETQYYIWVEAVNSEGKAISDVRDRTTRDLTLERGDYIRAHEDRAFGIEPGNGSLTVYWDLRDRIGWFEVYYAPVGVIPRVDIYGSTTFPRSNLYDPESTSLWPWSLGVYPAATQIPVNGSIPFHSNWVSYYIGAVNGLHPDGRPIMGIGDFGTDVTPPQRPPVNAFPYVLEGWLEGSHGLHPSVPTDLPSGTNSGLGYALRPYKTIDSRFHHADVKSWNGTAAGPGNVPVPLYATSTTITGLQNGTQYEVWIRVPNVNGERGYFYALGTPGASGLVAPGSVAVTAPDNTTRELDISWNEVTGAQGYRVYFSGFNQTPTATTEYVRVSSDTTTYTRTGLLPNTVYYVWVAAEENGIPGEISPVAQGITGAAPTSGVKGMEKKITGTNHAVKTLMYVEVNDNNPLNAGSYILENGAYLFDYVVIFASNLRSRNCALETEPHGCTRNGPHLHHNPNNRHILTNASKYIKPLQDKGIKVLMGILPDHDGISFGTMDATQRAAFVETVRQDVIAYGLDGIDLDDEWASKEDWDNWPNSETVSPTSIWVYPSATFGWPFPVTIYRDPSKPVAAGNGSLDDNISTSAQRNKMWHDLGIGTFKTIQALRTALGPDKTISVYEYNTGRYITPGGVNPEDTTITSEALANLIDFSLNPMYNQYLAESANGLPRAKYGSLAVDVSGRAYASFNGAPSPPMNHTNANSITDYANRFKDAAINGNPYGFIDFYGLVPSTQLLKRATNSAVADVTKEEYLSIMTEILFGSKTILTAEGGDYRKDW